MVYDPTTGKVLLFGGCQFFNDPSPAYSDLWAYDAVANTWTELHPAGAVPPAREGHAMVYDPGTARVILFGGRDFARENGFDDLWSYDPIANAWTELYPAGGRSPGPCSEHVMVYDPTLAKIILYGGYREGVYELDVLDSLYTYDPAANVWTALQPDGTPGNRAGHAMVYHPGCGLTVLVGGECARELPSGGYVYPTFPETLWAYDPAANTWNTLKPAGRFPYGRAGHSMVYDSKNGEIIMFGGYRSLEDTSWRPMRREWLSGTWILTP
jgi:N-acetylneuraminic acid mutarotase